MDELSKDPRQSIRLHFDDVPRYLRRYAVEVETWARAAGGRRILQTGTYPAVTDTALSPLAF